MLFIEASLVSYFIACILYFVYLAFRNATAGKIAYGAIAAGFLLNTGAIVIRWFAVGRPPLSSMFETMVFFSWSVALVYLCTEAILKFKFIGPFAALLSILALAYASLLDASLRPLVPALRSNWLVVHVISYFIGYGAAAVATAASAAYIVCSWRSAIDREFLSKLDAVSYPLIMFAFPFLTIGLTTGAVWANKAWGSYWSWDPKETWSLLTWFVYAGYLHVRLVKGWQGARMAYIALIGFAAILFTFIGVNIFFGGMHSY
jgi:cytochrome c-type biogenesis protein CcsB